MAEKDSPQSVIESYKRRQQMMPFLIGGLAVLLVMVGVIILLIWMLGNQNGPRLSLSNTDTPTVTMTYTATNVPPTDTETATETETATSTITETATPSGPMEYTVKEGDNCWAIAQEFKVELEVLLAINGLETCKISPGQKIYIPQPDQVLPSPTLYNIVGLPKGKVIDYVIRKGDTLDLIASLFNSTVADIKSLNKITNANKINIGDKIKVRVNLVTPTPTKAPTSTPNPASITLVALTPTPTK
jgi:LysM repeat protein